MKSTVIAKTGKILGRAGLALGYTLLIFQAGTLAQQHRYMDSGINLVVSAVWLSIIILHISNLVHDTEISIYRELESIVKKASDEVSKDRSK